MKNFKNEFEEMKYLIKGNSGLRLKFKTKVYLCASFMFGHIPKRLVIRVVENENALMNIK